MTLSQKYVATRRYLYVSRKSKTLFTGLSYLVGFFESAMLLKVTLEGKCVYHKSLLCRKCVMINNAKKFACLMSKHRM